RDGRDGESRRDRRKNSGREDDRRRDGGWWGDRAPRERDVRRDGSVRESSRRNQEFGSRPPKKRREKSGVEM
ncbi:MAG: hypothetical protein NC121_05830, partial [Blautia sp.]|nr:hypothetical protein [Blautia sp.]